MKARGTIRTGIVVAAIIVGFWSTNRLCHFLLQASHVSFNFDSFLSKTQQEKIIFTVSQAGLTNPVLIAELIKQKCIAVDTVSIRRHPDHTWHIAVIAAEPTLIVNNDWILNKQGILVPRGLYAAEKSGTLPQVTMKTVGKSIPIVSHAFRQWLSHVTPALYEYYCITWNHDYEIVLTEKSNPSFSLITTCLHNVTEHAIALCDEIKKDINNRMAHSSRHKAWKADIRFEKQIVLSGGLEGDRHG